MKVMLIDPKTNFSTPEAKRGIPYGLMAVAGAIKDLTETELIDLNIRNMNTEELIGRVYDSNIVGITCFMDTFREVQGLCKLFS